MFNKVNRHSIIAGGIFLMMASSAQAVVYQMSTHALCSIVEETEQHVTFNYNTVKEEPGAKVYSRATQVGNTISPIFISTSAWIADYSNFSSPVVYDFDTTYKNPEDYYARSRAYIKSTSTNPNQTLSAYASISGPGATYIHNDSIKLGNIPLSERYPVGCSGESDYKVI